MDYVKVNLDNAISTLAKLGAPPSRFGEILAGIAEGFYKGLEQLRAMKCM